MFIVKSQQSHTVLGFIPELKYVLLRNNTTNKLELWTRSRGIQQHYGSRWEDVTQEEIYREAIQRHREYRSNTNYPTRIVTRKEPNPLWKGAS